MWFKIIITVAALAAVLAFQFFVSNGSEDLVEEPTEQEQVLTDDYQPVDPMMEGDAPAEGGLEDGAMEDGAEPTDEKETEEPY